MGQKSGSTKASRRHHRRSAVASGTAWAYVGKIISVPTRLALRKLFFPLLNSKVVLWLTTLTVILFGASLLRSAVTASLAALPPDAVTFDAQGTHKLEDVLQTKLTDAARSARAKGTTRTAFVKQVRRILAAYPAIEMAHIQSRANGSMHIRATVHTPSFEIRDRTGRRFLFGSKLVAIASLAAHDSVLGLGQPPLTLTMGDADLSADRGSKNKIQKSSAGSSHSINVTLLYKTILEINRVVENASPNLRLVPPGSYSLTDENGIQMCLAAANQNGAIRCTLVLLGHEPDTVALESATKQLAVNPKAQSAYSIDLRIPGRAILRSDDLAELSTAPKP